MKYKVIKSGRKTVSLEISRDAEVIVRAPYGTKDKFIEEFVNSHKPWIEKHLNGRLEKAEMFKYAEENSKALKKAAKEYIFKRAEEFAEIMNVKYSGIKITSAKTRFGSCSGKNSLCFSYILMLYPKEAVDYVIVHELAHTVEHNHSKRFYKIIEKYLPDYKQRERMLKK